MAVLTISIDLTKNEFQIHGRKRRLSTVWQILKFLRE